MLRRLTTSADSRNEVVHGIVDHKTAVNKLAIQRLQRITEKFQASLASVGRKMPNPSPVLIGIG